MGTEAIKLTYEMTFSKPEDGFLERALCWRFQTTVVNALKAEFPGQQIILKWDKIDA